MKRLERVLVMAGGTGGHVFPALATARQLQSDGVEVRWLGTRAGIEARIVPAAGIDITYLDIAGVRGQGLKRLLLAPLKISAGVLQTMRLIRQFKPDFVIGMGGFVTGPGGVAAWLSGVPLFIHEQNAIAGFTNRLLSRLARHVYQAFPGAFPDTHATTVGNPVRVDIASIPAPEQRFAGREGPVRLLVVGGSQGAVALNQLLPQAFALLDHSMYEIVHQTGQKDRDATLSRYEQSGVRADVRAFIDDMAASYAWADAVICRSGALTVSEIAAAGIGSLLVPYPFAVDDHQTLNAEFLVKGGAARILQQKALTPALLADDIRTHFSDRARLMSMAANARRLAKPESTVDLVNACKEALNA
jgi:UDP-N-acetylglucosamine--N-acetylmuramyl-(pentapeptide) pyrophosphoryl-undecaprenol N-acetylglucosamine transferase